MKTFILLILFICFNSCEAGIVKIWKLREIVLDATNENLVGTSTEDISFGIVVYLAHHESKEIQLDEEVFKAIKNRGKTSDSHPFLGESETYALKVSDEKIYFVEADKLKHGLCRIAMIDGKLWPVASISGQKTTVYLPKLASLLTEYHKETVK